jgi:Ca2+-binding RTX toxin-like protein
VTLGLHNSRGFGGDGDDTIKCDEFLGSFAAEQDGSDEVEAYGGPGDDSISSIFGFSNTLSGGLGDDTVQGSYGRLEGGQGKDVIEAGSTSEAYGNIDGDEVYGNAFGGQGADSVFGGSGAEVVYGNNGDNLIYGNKDGDTVYGNAGDDTLYGGTSPEFDRVDPDTFVIEDVTGPSGQDTIVDFEVGSDTVRIARNINDSGFDSFADLTVTESADGHAVIELGEDNSLTLKGVAPDALSESDFSFF